MIEKEVQELELAERSQVLPQVWSIAHDFLDQDSQVSPAQTKRSSTRGFIEDVFHNRISFVSRTLLDEPNNLFE